MCWRQSHPALQTGDNTPARCEQLAILVSMCKSKDTTVAQLTHDQAKRLSGKDDNSQVLQQVRVTHGHQNN